MPVVSERHRLAYFPAPKVACTTLKHVMHLIEHGRPHVDHEGPDGSWVHIHSLYETQPFPPGIAHLDGFFRFALVRDPVDRLVSAWMNRVLHHRELGPEHVDPAALAALGLEAEPCFAGFVDRLDDYRAVSASIRHHTDPLVAFLGRSAEVYDLVVPQSRLGLVIAALRERTSLDLPEPRLQATPRDLPRPVPDAALRRLIERRYEDDHAAFGVLF